MEIIGWILTLLAMAGAVLISYKRIEGFYCWLISNLGWVGYSVVNKMWHQAVLWMFYQFICLNGIRQWKKK